MTDRNENPFDRMDEDYPFEDFEAETTAESDATPGRRAKKRTGNRNFWIAVGILAAVFVVVVIILTVITFVIVPQNQQARLEEAARINAHNTATAQAATDFAILQAEKEKATETQMPTDTLEPSSTPVVVFDTETPEPSPSATDEGVIGGPADDDARTATVAALLTQAAGGGTQVSTVEGGAPTSTALPDSGLMEDIGLPALLGLAVIMVLVIVFARRLRLRAS